MKNREDKYLAFEQSFKTSGKSQKEYSEQSGISRSMVSYYLRKAREIKKSIGGNEPLGAAFQKIELINEEVKETIRIDLPNGIVITLTI